MALHLGHAAASVTDAEAEPALEQEALDELLRRHPVENALELDVCGRRFLDHAVDRIPRICRVPASTGGEDAPQPLERFALVTALGLLDEDDDHRDRCLSWATGRIAHRGRLLVSAHGCRPGLRDTYRRLRLRQRPLLGPDGAEDLLADAGFLVEHLEVDSRWDPLAAPALVVVATRA